MKRIVMLLLLAAGFFGSGNAQAQPIMMAPEDTLCMACHEKYLGGGNYEHYFDQLPCATQGLCRKCISGGPGHTGCHANDLGESCSSHADCTGARLAIAEEVEPLIADIQSGRQPERASNLLATLVAEKAWLTYDRRSNSLVAIGCDGAVENRWYLGASANDALRKAV